jgi:holo-[acyl-carrier protein] synthase
MTHVPAPRSRPVGGEFAQSAMIHGVGVDIVQLARIRQAIAAYGERVLHRIYSPDEITYCEADAERRIERYAARFAAKEAAFKAFRDDLGGALSWHDFEVEHDEMGAPGFHLSGRAADICAQLGIRRVHLSLSHTHVSASAVVVAEK